MEAMSKKGVMGTIFVGIIVIILILSIVFLTYKYAISDNTSGGANVDKSDITKGVDGAQEQVNGVAEDEKPPRPPE